ncbi:MAG: hypothetical protein HRU34_20415 [Richelia sp.]|nr:hypothetical protein [Richelia sp.]
MRLRIPSELRQTHMMTQIFSTLQAFFPEIENVRINPAIGSITIYDGGEIESFEEILTKLESF